MPIKHLKVSPKADGPDPGNVHASDWNATHDLSTLVVGDITNFEAPIDGKQYARQDAAWSEVVATGGGGVPEAPIDTLVYGRKDGDWARAVDVNGDTMTGPLRIATYDSAILRLDKGTGGNDERASYVIGMRNNSTRWMMAIGSGDPETGGDVGSDFALHRFSDTEGYKGLSLLISRSTGQAFFESMITAPALKVEAQIPEVVLNKTSSGQPAQLRGDMAGLSRWLLQLGNESAESGGNSGSDFTLARCGDDGEFKDQPLLISRATGKVTFSNGAILPLAPTAPTEAANKAYVDAAIAAGGGGGGTYVLKAGDTMTGPLKLADGTVAAPSLAFASEAGLGIYRSAAGVIRMAAGGVNTVVFNVATGNASLTGNASNAGFYLNKAAGNYYSVLQGGVGAAGVPRWGMNLGDGTAETGTNTGSNFSLTRYNDAGSTQAFVLRINRATGTMTFGPGTERTAVATDQPTAATLDLNKAGSGSVNQIVGVTNGVLRWVMRLGDSAAESGSNAGSDFSLSRYDDAGANIGTPFTIARSTGVMSLGSPVYILGVTQSASAVLRLQKLAGANANSLEGAGSNGASRWALQIGNGSAETGSNAGSDFALYRYADNGTFLETAFTMYRSSGAAYFSNQVEVGSNIFVNGNPLATSAQLVLNKPTASESVIHAQNAGVTQWRLIMGDGSAARDLHLQSSNDAGAYLATPLYINRLNGTIRLTGPIELNGSVTNNGAMTITGAASVGGQFSAGSGGGFRWDGGNYNYTGMGAGLGPGWSWQYQRDTGTLRWLNWEPRSVFQIDGNGSVTAAGTINVPAGGAIYATHLRGGGGNPTSGLFNFNWYDDGTAPSYLWGSSDAVNMRVYPPSRLSVAYATNSGTVGGCSPDRIAAWGLSNGNGYAAYYRASADSSIKWLLTTDGGLGLATTQGANTNIYWHNQSGGQGYLGSNPIGGASDERMKENIADSTIDASAQVRAMRFIEFNYKSEVRPGIDTKHHDLGFSAQNLRAIKDALVFDEPDGYMKPDQQEVILTLAKALQETIARLDQLEKT